MNAVEKSERLMSLDALRGFDMFWIIGGGSLLSNISRVTPWEWDAFLMVQMTHVDWEGFRFFDLIFPLFMFLAGVSIPYAIIGKLEKGASRKELLAKVFRRTVTLLVLGLLYNRFLNFNFSSLRYASVLGQIGVAYGIAASVIIFSHKKYSALLAALVVMGLCAILQLWVPVPGQDMGQFTKTASMNGFIDSFLLPGKMYGGSFDPEGWLCMFSASAIVLMGVQAGQVLRSSSFTEMRKVVILLGSSLFCLGLGFALSPVYPCIKALWTGTFNLIAGGFSLLLLSLFYLVIDVWKFRFGVRFFTIIGLNSITIYLAYRIVDFGKIGAFFFSGLANWLGDYRNVVLLAGMIAVEWLFLLFLYRKKIFLKV